VTRAPRCVPGRPSRGQRIRHFTRPGLPDQAVYGMTNVVSCVPALPCEEAGAPKEERERDSMRPTMHDATTELARRGASAMRIAPRLAALAPLLIVAACASDRFASSPGPATGSGYRSAGAATSGSDFEPLPPSASAEVIASPLPPAPGTAAAPDGSTVAPGTLGPDGTLSGTGGTSGPVASLGSQPTSAPAAPTRSAVTGGWTAREAAGGSCRITLSSAPALDLYKASTSGCAGRDLQSVNAWDLRDGEVYLYSRGSVVARLKGGGSSFNGVLAKSGAPLTLSR